MLSGVVQSRMSEGFRVYTQEELTVEQLQIEASRRDPAEFAPLYDKYYRSVLGFVYNRVEDKEQAFDVTSQVFHQALESLHRYSFRGLPISAWLYRIALNTLGKLYRSGKVRRTVSLSDKTERELANETDHSSVTDEVLFRALQSLEEDEMQLVEMRFFEQRPFAEIAEIIGNTESAVKQRLYKILGILKDRINKLEEQ